MLQQYWSREHAGRPYLPVTAIAAAFRESKQGIGERQALAQPFDRGRMHPLALCKRRYALSSWAMLRVCLHREALLMWRNAFLYGFRTAQVRSAVHSHHFLKSTQRKQDVPQFF